MAINFKVGQRYQASVGTRTVVGFEKFAIGSTLVPVVAFTVDDSENIQMRVADRITGWTLIPEEGAEEVVTLASGAEVVINGETVHVFESPDDHSGTLVEITPADRQALIDALTNTAPKEVSP